MLSHVLMHKPLRHPGMPLHLVTTSSGGLVTGLSSHGLGQDSQDVSSIVLALRTLGSFNFDGKSWFYYRWTLFYRLINFFLFISCHQHQILSPRYKVSFTDPYHSRFLPLTSCSFPLHINSYFASCKGLNPFTKIEIKRGISYQNNEEVSG
jgi:hypothetical protein